MRRILTLIGLSFALTLTALAHAAIPSDPTSALAAAKQEPFVPIYYIYTAARDFDVTPVAIETEDGTHPNTNHIVLRFEKGDALVVEETTRDDQGRLLVRFGLEEAAEGEPNSFWVYADELTYEELRPAIASLSQLLNADGSGLERPDEEYVETDFAAKKGGRAKTRVRGSYCTSHPTAKGCCKSAVNYKLIAMGLIKTRVNGAAATSMAPGLASRGWREVGCKARSKPSVGMTCVFNGGKWGHTEVFTGKCWYYGAKCGAAMRQANRSCFSCKVPGYSSRYKKK